MKKEREIIPERACTLTQEKERTMMTQREFNEMVIALVNGTEVSATPDELVEFATANIEKIDAANEKRRIKNAEKKAEKAPLYDAALALLTNEFQTTSAIAEKMEISTPKATPILRDLVESGKAVAGEVKVPKKGTQRAYKLA